MTITTAFITGAASGIGRALALQLAADAPAPKVMALADQDDVGLTDVAAALRGKVDTVLPFAIDIRDNDTLSKALEETSRAGQDAGGPLDLVINNAGVMTGPPLIPNTSAAAIDRAIDVNFRATVFATSFAVGLMEEQGGAIVNVASGAALSPLPTDPVYAGTKAAVMMFTKSLALAFKDTPIRLNTVCPGVVDTPILAQNGDGGETPEFKAFIQHFDILTADDVAGAVLAVARDTGANGQVIEVKNTPKGTG